MLLFSSMRASLPHIQATRGSAFVAINEWLSYFNVRMKQVEIRAGTEVIMKVEPVRHVVSDDFRELDQEERGCLLQDEQVLVSCHINNNNNTLCFQLNKTSMFQFYKQTKCLFECRLRSDMRPLCPVFSVLSVVC